MTRESLARLAGVTSKTVERLELGKHRPQIDTITKLCSALDSLVPFSRDELEILSTIADIGQDALVNDAERRKRALFLELERAQPAADASRLLSLLEGLIDICGSVEDAQERLQFLVAFEAHQRGRESVKLDQAQDDESKPLAITRGEQFIDEGLIAETVTIYSKPISPPAPAHKAKSPKKSTTLRAANG